MAGWGLVRAATRQQRDAQRKIDAEQNLASATMSDDKGKAATPDPIQEESIPSGHPETSRGERDTEPQDGRPPPPSLRTTSQALIAEDEEKVSAESQQEETTPPTEKARDTASRTGGRLWRILRAKLRLSSLYRKGVTTKPTSKNEETEIIDSEGELQNQTAEASKSEDDGKTAGSSYEEPPPGKKRWRILRYLFYLVNVLKKEHKVEAAVETKSTEIATELAKPADDVEFPADTKSEAKEPSMSPEVDERLEKILEQEGVNDMGVHFSKLDGIQRQCMLCFSIFDPFERIRKRAMIYWWIGEGFAFRNGDKTAEAAGEEIFEELVENEFIEPTLYNLCTGSILECTIHPFVHWMLKSKARDAFFSDFDSRGKPILPLTHSRRACLVGDNMPELMAKITSSGSAKETESTTATANESEGVTSSANQTESTTASTQKKSEEVTNQIEATATTTKKSEEVPSSANQIKSKTDTKKRSNSITPSCFKRKIQGEQPRQEGSTPRPNEATSRLSVIFNLSSRRFYNLDANLFENLKNLVVLQLGRWHRDSVDSKYYIVVDDYTFLSSISHLKKLRSLGLQGMCRLTELPFQFKELRRLLILDLRGCQNLETLTVQVKHLTMLTHLDLTECYMLEYIPQGIGLLSELQVFKGFVFGGAESKKTRCKLQELAKLKKLWKLSLNIPTEARISHGEMSSLKNFGKLKNLTITWGQLPTIVGEEDLLEHWTTLEPPPNLEKLDLRCYPKKRLPRWFAGVKNLIKLYIRGGSLETILPEGFERPEQIHLKIEVLRLKHLQDFSIEWEEVQKMLQKLKRMEVVKCSIKSAPPVDQNGVWVKDERTKEVTDPSTATTEPPSEDVQQAMPSSEAQASVSAADAPKDTSAPQPDPAASESEAPVSEAEAPTSAADVTEEAEAPISEEDPTKDTPAQESDPTVSKVEPPISAADVTKATIAKPDPSVSEAEVPTSVADVTEDTSAPQSDPAASKSEAPISAADDAEGITEQESDRFDSESDSAADVTEETSAPKSDPTEDTIAQESEHSDSEAQAPISASSSTESDPTVPKVEAPISAADDTKATIAEPDPTVSEAQAPKSDSAVSEAQAHISAADVIGDTGAPTPNLAALPDETPAPKPPTSEVVHDSTLSQEKPTSESRPPDTSTPKSDDVSEVQAPTSPADVTKEDTGTMKYEQDASTIHGAINAADVAQYARSPKEYDSVVSEAVASTTGTDVSKDTNATKSDHDVYTIQGPINAAGVAEDARSAETYDTSISEAEASTF